VDFFIDHWHRFRETYNIANGVFVSHQEKSFAEAHSDYLSKHIFSDAPGRLICNFGCGKGTHSIPLEQRGFRVVNLDQSLDVLKLTSSFYFHQKMVSLLVCADIEHAPFRDSVFDGIMNFGVMEHFHDIGGPL
jgi:SAM-dependent methyltransferase